MVGNEFCLTDMELKFSCKAKANGAQDGMPPCSSGKALHKRQVAISMTNLCRERTSSSHWSVGCCILVLRANLLRQDKAAGEKMTDSGILVAASVKTDGPQTVSTLYTMVDGA